MTQGLKSSRGVQDEGVRGCSWQEGGSRGCRWKEGGSRGCRWQEGGQKVGGHVAGEREGPRAERGEGAVLDVRAKTYPPEKDGPGLVQHERGRDEGSEGVRVW